MYYGGSHGARELGPTAESPAKCGAWWQSPPFAHPAPVGGLLAEGHGVTAAALTVRPVPLGSGCAPRLSPRAPVLYGGRCVSVASMAVTAVPLSVPTNVAGRAPGCWRAERFPDAISTPVDSGARERPDAGLPAQPACLPRGGASGRKASRVRAPCPKRGGAFPSSSQPLLLPNCCAETLQPRSH